MKSIKSISISAILMLVMFVSLVVQIAEVQAESLDRRDYSNSFPTNNRLMKHSTVAAPSQTDISNSVTSDLNREGIVGHADLRIMINNWGPCPETAKKCWGDLNNDNIVSMPDLAILLDAWTEGETTDKDKISQLPQKCESIIDVKLQKLCLRRAFQEKNIEMIRSKVAVKLDDKLSDVDSDRKETVRRDMERVFANYTKHMGNMINRMTAAIERLIVLADRIESRIVKFSEADQDVSEAGEILAEARVQIEQSNSKLAELSAAYQKILDSENDFMTEFREIRQMALGVKEHIKSAHAGLVRAIVVLKPGRSD